MSRRSHHGGEGGDKAPGDGTEAHGGLGAYLLGLALASLLTVVAFSLPRLGLVWPPSVPVALAVLAVAQMGVHLVFFLHITTGPDNTNNILALAFGLMIVFLIISGSLFIMHAMNTNMNAGMQM